MTETVSDVIALRSASAEPFSQTVGWSIGVHVVLIAALVLSLPRLQNTLSEAPTTVMNISLGGAPGPVTGGMTPMAGRVVQAPPPEVAPARADRPPAVAEPEMAIPTPTPTPPRPEVERTSEAARGTTPTTGEEPQDGEARTDTGARGQGFGLTTGGEGGAAAYLDMGDFCCPDYLSQMVQLIQRNWDGRQNITGSTLMQFTVFRSGAISNVQVERPSGFLALDLAAQRALLLTQLPGLPAAFPNPDLTVHIRFEYRR